MDTLPPLDVIAKEIVEMLPDYTFNVKLLFRASLIEDELVVTANPVMRDMLVKRLWM